MDNPYDFVVNGALMYCDGSEGQKDTVVEFQCTDRGLLIGNKYAGLQSDCNCPVNFKSPQYFVACLKTNSKCEPSFIGEWINTAVKDRVVDGVKLAQNLEQLRSACLEAVKALKIYVQTCEADFKDDFFNWDNFCEMMTGFGNFFTNETDEEKEKENQNWLEIQKDESLKKWVDSMNREDLALLPDQINYVWKEYQSREPSNAKDISAQTHTSMEKVKSKWAAVSSDVNRKQLEQAYQTAADQVKKSLEDFKQCVDGKPLLMMQSVLVCSRLGIVHFLTSGQVLASKSDSADELVNDSVKALAQRLNKLNGKEIKVQNDGQTPYTVVFNMPYEHLEALVRMANTQNIEPTIVLAIIAHESGFGSSKINTQSTIYGHAQGYMQVMEKLYFNNLNSKIETKNIALEYADESEIGNDMLNPFGNIAAGINTLTLFREWYGEENMLPAMRSGGGYKSASAQQNKKEFLDIKKQIDGLLENVK